MILLTKKTYFARGISFGSSETLIAVKYKAMYLDAISDSILLLWK